jgi:preprotein translocase subunit SecF
MLERIKDYLNELDIDFVRWRYVAGGVSGAMVLLAWVLFFTVGPNWGIDFTGGTEIHLDFEDEVKIGEVREALRTIGLPDDSVQQIGAPEQSEFKVRIQDATFGADQAKKDVLDRLTGKYGADWIESSTYDAQVGARFSIVHKGDPVPLQDVQALFDDVQGVSVQHGRDENQIIIQLPGLTDEVQAELQSAFGDKKFEVPQVQAVGPKVGADLRRQAFVAMFATLFLVLVYVAFRFELAFAPGAIIALFHDVSVTIGFFIIFQKEFSLALVGALLTIVGYSLNDTIVIYDRIRENQEKYRRKSMKEIINLSVNETLTRTISTSFNTLLAISPFLVIGGPVVGDFAFAMLLGIVFGSYSTVYVASPMILIMQDLQPYLQRLVVNPSGKTAMAPAGGEPPPGPGPEGGAPAPERPMTESEKRRRERAEKEKAGQR